MGDKANFDRRGSIPGCGKLAWRFPDLVRVRLTGQTGRFSRARLNQRTGLLASTTTSGVTASDSPRQKCGVKISRACAL